jgi:hypothetical protein
MDASTIQVLKKELKLIEMNKSALGKKKEELKMYEGMVLIPSVKSYGRVYYYTIDPKSGRRVYLGGEEHPDVQNIKALHHINLSMKLIENDSSLIVPALDKAADHSPDAVDQMLPKVYRNSSLGMGSAPDVRAAKWKTDKEAFKAAYLEKYPDKYPETLTYQRWTGEWMRSKSEGSIADILDMNGLTWIYELPHKCNGYWLLSDFTVLSPLDLLAEIISEHAGRMDLESYRNKYIFSLEHYMKEGYRPNINLFFTFDNLDQTFSQMPVQSILENWLRAGA